MSVLVKYTVEYKMCMSRILCQADRIMKGFSNRKKTTWAWPGRKLSSVLVLPLRKSIHYGNANLPDLLFEPYIFCIRLQISLAPILSAVKNCTTTFGGIHKIWTMPLNVIYVIIYASGGIWWYRMHSQQSSFLKLTFFWCFYLLLCVFK